MINLKIIGLLMLAAIIPSCIKPPVRTVRIYSLDERRNCQTGRHYKTIDRVEIEEHKEDDETINYSYHCNVNGGTYNLHEKSELVE